MGRNRTLKEEYFEWLYSQIGRRKESYRTLCAELHRISFRWFVHNDDNRCEDGLNLRRAYVEDNRLDESHLEVQYFLKGDCTVFEVLVGLAQRINDLMYDLHTTDSHAPRWFKEMISNLEMGDLTDENAMFNRVTLLFVEKKVSRLMDRTYDFYGRGGLFPLKRKPPKDQREVEIWYQLMSYLDENYGL